MKYILCLLLLSHSSWYHVSDMIDIQEYMKTVFEEPLHRQELQQILFFNKAKRSLYL